MIGQFSIQGLTASLAESGRWSVAGEPTEDRRKLQQFLNSQCAVLPYSPSHGEFGHGPFHAAVKALEQYHPVIIQAPSFEPEPEGEEVAY